MLGHLLYSNLSDGLEPYCPGKSARESCLTVILSFWIYTTKQGLGEMAVSDLFITDYKVKADE